MTGTVMSLAVGHRTRRRSPTDESVRVKAVEPFFHDIALSPRAVLDPRSCRVSRNHE